MCIIIDAELFTATTNVRSKEYTDLKPVIDWIVYGKGKAVYGGLKYAREVKKHGKFRGFLTELEHISKTVHANDQDVDFTHCYLERKFKSSNYNDHHIVAIQVVSGCKLVCTVDQGLHSLIKACYLSKEIKKIKRDCLNPGSLERPKIYQNKRTHKKLLNDANIASCCM